MEPIAIYFASALVFKVIDELLAKSENKWVKKYKGIFSWTASLARILITKKIGR